jgi:hypothetical protein
MGWSRGRGAAALAAFPVEGAPCHALLGGVLNLLA